MILVPFMLHISSSGGTATSKALNIVRNADRGTTRVKCAGSPRTAVPRCQPYSVRPEQRFLVLCSVITKTVVRLITAQIVA